MSDSDIEVSKESNPKKFLEEEYLSVETKVCFTCVSASLYICTYVCCSNFYCA